MWKLLRGKVEFDLFLDHTLKNDEGIFSTFDIEEPESYPCLVRVVYLVGMAYDVVYVYVNEATVLLKVYENGGVL